MDWEAVGAIGEIVGATAVVITLAYLAVQIRQNTKVARSAARQAIAEMSMSAASDLVNDKELAQAFLADLAGTDLEPVERLRLTGRCYVAMRHWENIHYQYLSGMLSESEWRGFRLNLAAIMEWQTMRTFWKNEQQFYSEPFQKEVASVQRELASPKDSLRHGYVLGDGPAGSEHGAT